MPAQANTKEAAIKVISVFSAIQRWRHWYEIQLCAQKEYTMPAKEFYRLLPEYQRFIALTAGYEGIGMLSAQVDKLWHAHILNTKRYYDFCQQYLGRLVHHLPCSSYVLYGYVISEEYPRGNLPLSLPNCGDIAPSCNAMDSGETFSEIRATILTAAERFYQAYRECYGVMPSADVWERLALLPETEGVTL
jgi:hypothetical protein